MSEGPYRRLQRIMVQWVGKVKHPRRRIMYQFGDVELRDRYDLSGIAERVAAAHDLGWNTHITYMDRILKITYVERPPDPPMEIFP